MAAGIFLFGSMLGLDRGVAAAMTGDHPADYLSSTDENKITILVGPRYAITAWKGHQRPRPSGGSNS
jgi:hypothetical protein